MASTDGMGNFKDQLQLLNLGYLLECHIRLQNIELFPQYVKYNLSYKLSMKL